MKLAALCVARSEASRLYVGAGEGYAAVDDLAVDQAPHLTGLRDVGELMTLGPEALEELRALSEGAEPTVDAGMVRYAPPVRHPGKIVCVGLNYFAHIAESGVSRPERIVLFAKFPSCLVGHGAEVVLPSITSELDYEGELAVVIGSRARAVSVKDALDYIGGYTIINDVSARDLQREEPQWVRGKALDTFAPLGPVVVDARSAPPIGEMRIRTIVNGEIRQDALCSMMITPVPELIAYISAAITLEPGDVIATGTPAGVASGMERPVYLSGGDTMSVEITDIGILTNRVVAAR